MNKNFSLWVKIGYIICVLFLSTVRTAFAQDELVLTFDQSISIALDKSYNIKSLEQSNVRAERNLWAAKAAYRTNATSSLFAPVYNEGFKLVEIVDGNPVPKQYGDFRIRGVFDINQPMPWLPLGGGTLTFRSEAYQLNSWTPLAMDPAIDLKSNQIYTSLSLRLDKPLFTINELALNLKQAELGYERQFRVFKRSELDLVYQVTNAFFQLYRRDQQKQIDQEKVRRQEEIYNTTKNKFEAGLIAEVDAMQAEVDLIQYQNDLKASEGRFAEQESMFKQLIGLPLETKIRVETDLELKPVYIDLDKAFAMAMQNRSEIVEKKLDIESQKITIQQVDARVSVNGNLTGYYDLAGFSDSDLPYGTPTNDLFISSWEVLKKTPNRGLSFQLEVPIWDWGRNGAEVDAAEAVLKQEELNLENLNVTIEREVRDVVRSVYEAYDRVQMLSKSKDVSEKSFGISLQRFANGDITSMELAYDNERLNTTKISYLTAYIEYQMALADLKRKTLYDFANQRSLVE